ncbi:hypothetical protein QBZ16_003842 [Prototheca wickerhamii]|uniref:J domain-containing protein n=1 Tax=Prototheca wickerhamii TaxID=3111 RepID=A0AAD9IGD7_PROWI|nr:hypothetical protein QBZ16_003842 [Prototheca wickerhamii]
MSTVDALLQRLKGREGTNAGTGTDSSPRFLVIKQSWRGQYPRILSISHTAITTRFPDTDDVTNTWSLTGDADVLGIEVGGASPEGGLFTIKISQRKRRSESYEVAVWRPLARLAAVVRYGYDEQWAGLEWVDGTRSTFVCAHRDALLAAVVDAAAARGRGRAIAVLARPSAPGDALVATGAAGAPATARHPEVERCALLALAAAARAFLAAGRGVQAIAEHAAPLRDVESAPFQTATSATLVRRDASPASSGSSTPVARSATAQTVRRAFVRGPAGGAAADAAPVQDEASARFARPRARPRPDEGVVPALLARLPTLEGPRRGPGAALGRHGPGRHGRLFACLADGDTLLGYHAARVVLRLLSPRSGRTGLPSWRAAEPGGGDATPGVAAARAALFVSDSRARELVAPLAGGPRASPLLALAVVEAVGAAACGPGPRRPTRARWARCWARSARWAARCLRCSTTPRRACPRRPRCCSAPSPTRARPAVAPVRAAALAHGALLLHLLGALGPAGTSATRLSREMVALWCDEYAPALSLLRRVFPPGLVRFLNQRKAGAAAALRPVRTERRETIGSGDGAHVLAASVDRGVIREAPGQAASSETDPLAAASTTAVADRGSAADNASSAAPSAGPPLPLPTATPEDHPISSTPTHAVAQAHPADPRSPTLTAPTHPSPPSRRQLAARLGRHQQSALRGNWDAFWLNVDRDHAHAALVWNAAARAELREALRAERERAAAGGSRRGRTRQATGAGVTQPPPICWNHEEFSVALPSLSRQLCVAGVYPRLLVEGGDPAAVAKLGDPRDFFGSAYHEFLFLGEAPRGWDGGAPTEEAARRAHDARCLILRAMAAAMRALGVDLLAALVSPPSSVGEDAGGAARQAATANGEALVRAGGVGFLLDAVASAHEEQSGGVTALHGNLLAGSAANEPLRDWLVVLGEQGEGIGGHDSDPSSGATMNDAPQSSDTPLLSWKPVTREELRRAYQTGLLTQTSPVRFKDWDAPRPLGAVRELVWALAPEGRGYAGALPFARRALDVLGALSALRPALGAGGAVVTPAPAALRALRSEEALPLLAQLLLCNDPALVSGACALLLRVLGGLTEDDLELGRLYRTGIFFFILAYCGSNQLEAAHLLRATHLAQHTQRAGLDEDDALLLGSLAQRSFLSGLVPASLIFCLEEKGPEAFAAALVGDSDTPELIWTHSMRLKRLVPQMLRHLGDFPLRLREHGHARYEYTPCPPVGYPEIEEELWCHKYYLRHLVDEARFPDWPVREALPLLQSLLDAWRAELARQPLSMTEAEACAVLGVAPEEGGAVPEEARKAAFRRLARLYHPDRNPQGRELFERVREAYARLQAGATGGQGPQPWRLLLILKAQCLVYRRCARDLRPFKYAGYDLLLQALELPEAGGDPSAHFLSPETAPHISAAAELLALTCACSRPNGEEVASRPGGLDTLAALLQRCAAIVPDDLAPGRPEAHILLHCLRCLGVIASVQSGHARLAATPGLVRDVVRCARLTRAHDCRDAALRAAIAMTGSVLLQRALLRARRRAGGRGAAAARLASSLAARRNASAALAARALAGLAGYQPASDGPWQADADAEEEDVGLAEANEPAALAYGVPDPASQPYPEARAALEGLLTPPLAARLLAGAGDPRPTLRVLSGVAGTHDPEMVWDLAMREELLEVLERLRAAEADEQAAAAAAHSYASVATELRIGGVFVRLYLESGGSEVSDPVGFCKALVVYASERQRWPAGAVWGEGEAGPGVGADGPQAQDDEGVLLALRALRLLLDRTPRLLGVLATRPAVEPLLRAIAAAVCPPPGGEGRDATADAIAEAALRVLGPLAAHAGCVGALASDQGVQTAFWACWRPPTAAARESALGLLAALSTLPLTAWAAAQRAGGLYLLDTVLRHVVGARAPEGAAWDEDASALAATAARASWPTCARSACTARACRCCCSARCRRRWWPRCWTAPRRRRWPVLGSASETPARIWNRDMLRRAAREVGALAAQAYATQEARTRREGFAATSASTTSGSTPPSPRAMGSRTPSSGSFSLGARVPSSPRLARAASSGSLAAEAGARVHRWDWAPEEGWGVRFPELEGEAFVGGVYVRLLLKDPQYPLRSPVDFATAAFDQLLAATAREGAERGLARPPPSSPRYAPPLTALVAQGAVDRLVRVLGHRLGLRCPGDAGSDAGSAPGTPVGSGEHGGLLRQSLSSGSLRGSAGFASWMAPDAFCPGQPDPVSLSLLRLLHRLVACTEGAEALSRTTRPAVPVLVAALAWDSAAARGVALETLLRGLAPANRQREALIGAAVARNLPAWLLAELATVAARSDQEARVLRVLIVDLLRALSTPGPHASELRALLDASPVWARESRQRHDLFLPAAAHAAIGGAGGGAASLLLHGNAETIRLLTAPTPVPAPPSLSSSGGSSADLRPRGALHAALLESQRTSGELRRSISSASSERSAGRGEHRVPADAFAVNSPPGSGALEAAAPVAVVQPGTPLDTPTAMALDRAPTFQGSVPEARARAAVTAQYAAAVMGAGPESRLVRDPGD